MATAMRSIASVATPMARNEQRPYLTAPAWTTGQVVTCNDGLWSGARLTMTRQWKRDGVNIDGETAATYTLVLADEGTVITCTVTATPADSNYLPRSATTDASPTIAAP